MKNARRIPVLAAGLFASLAAQAIGPSLTLQFMLEDPKSDEDAVVPTGRIDQHLCLQVRAVLRHVGEPLFSERIEIGAAGPRRLASLSSAR